MKRLLLTLGLILATTTWALADFFQFRDRRGNRYFRHAEVEVLTEGGAKGLGSTDGYGRIRLTLPKGEYELRLRYRGKEWRNVKVALDGNEDYTKVVTVP